MMMLSNRLSSRSRPPTIESIDLEDAIVRRGPDEKPSVDIILAAQHIAKVLNAVTHKDTIWWYDWDAGIYKDDQGMVTAAIVDAYNRIQTKDMPTSAFVREILMQIRAITYTTEYPFDQIEHIIPVRNGVIRLDAELAPIDPEGSDYVPRLHQHGPDWMLTKRLDVVYDPEVSTDDMVERLKGWLDEEEWVALVQIPALSILQSWGRVYKLAYLLEGPPDAGKSTYCELLMNFFGEAGYSLARLQDLISRQFSLYQLVGKWINIQDDLQSVPLRQTGSFKDLTGKGSHEVERKNHQPFVAKISAVHLYTCNTPPGVEFTDDDAFWSRWNYLYFGNRFERDPEVGASITDEESCSALLNLVIAEIIKILRDPSTIYRMDVDEVKERWTTAVDSVAGWLNECCERDVTAIVPKDELYEHHVEWCIEGNRTAADKAGMTRTLSRMGIVQHRATINGKRVQCYKGLRIKGKKSLQQHQFGWTPLDDFDDDRPEPIPNCPLDRFDRDMAMEPQWED